MASKKAPAKGKHGGCKTRPQLKRLVAKAQAEVAKLQKRQRAGTLAQVRLEAGLAEIQGRLADMEPWDVYTGH
jgi:hypothetical protein